ncbi:hypothetical protein CVIRNUC_006399 [Coccomyxa viridis]|uniref:Uncharacterized protein n=1 Tax=Coccomyxa viridis TaxID=1274662 RepID=A0AAV1IB26_9CHLO|nr:hypothetical protein CVIRNUC_006399 [Coccomyxa viridis]
MSYVIRPAVRAHCPPRPATGPVKARKRYPLTCTKATTETLESAKTQGDDDDDEDVDIQIEGLTDDYCDDFVCTSSPAVEQTLRSLAKDLVRRKWTPVLFARDVKYRDSYRRFSSAERHKRLLHIAENVKDAKVLVTRMQMLNKGQGVISWRLRGRLGAVPIDIDFQSTFELDLITGRVTEHVDSWDTNRCGLPARLAWNASRAAWSLAETGKDLREDAGKLLGKVKGDDSGGRQENIYADPSDPTKFFQQEDSTQKDLFSFALIAALLYLVASAYYQLEQIK